MRKIASHYWLRPDGSVGKFPIIVFNEQSEIIEIKERKTFQEEASLELINGFLSPGFIDFFPPKLENLDAAIVKKMLNDYIINGVKLLGVPPDFHALFNIGEKSQLEVTTYHVEHFIEGLTFSKIKHFKKSIEGLIKHTQQNAKLLNKESEFGSLELGKRPGLLAIQKMNYNSFQVNEESSLKIII